MTETPIDPVDAPPIKDVVASDDRAFDGARAVAGALVEGMGSVIEGKRGFLELFVAAVLSGGHVLVEDFPGLGKTTAAKTFASLVSGSSGIALAFRRLQCTPDLLPYDVTGVEVFDPVDRAFRFVPGPVFANVLLADELNRATPKTQSALLEAMAERHVTVGSETRQLPSPFIVVGTQNPVESEGTFPLPAAQLDRFAVRLAIGYPDRASELDVVERNPGRTVLPDLAPAVSSDELLGAMKAADCVFVARPLREAAVDLVRMTREKPTVALGASPRSALDLVAVMRAYALVKGREFANDEDLVAVAPATLAHRLKMRDPRIETDRLIREAALEAVDALRKA